MNEYPHLFQVDGRSLPGFPESLRDGLVRACEEVRARTGCSAWYHAGRMSVLWSPGVDIAGGGVEETLLFDRGCYLPICTDEAVRMLARTRRTRCEIDADVERSERANRDAMRRESERHGQDVGPEMSSVVRHLLRTVRDGPHSRRVFTFS